MKQRHKGKKSKDVCTCWACKDEKFRTKRQTTKTKALSEELKRDNEADDIILDYVIYDLFGYSE